jgi:hypothetical protein
LLHFLALLSIYHARFSLASLFYQLERLSISDPGSVLLLDFVLSIAKLAPKIRHLSIQGNSENPSSSSKSMEVSISEGEFSNLETLNLGISGVDPSQFGRWNFCSPSLYPFTQHFITLASSSCSSSSAIHSHRIIPSLPLHLLILPLLLVESLSRCCHNLTKLVQPSGQSRELLLAPNGFSKLQSWPFPMPKNGVYSAEAVINFLEGK